MSGRLAGALAAALTVLPAAAAPPDKAADDLVDATAIVPGLELDIRYATENNFVGRKLYDAPRCLLRRGVAERLARAQETLRKQGLKLVAYDCYRPRSVQAALWKAKPVRGLVAPPSKGGSNHNRGAAVDVGLLRLDGSKVELPTDFDDFSPAAHANSPLPSEAARRNRATLQAAMKAAGFKTIRLEWWHFDDPDAKRYPALDLPLM